MKIQNNISLKPLNTFNVDVLANTVCTLQSNDDFSLEKICKYLSKYIILGGGSNILFSKDFDGTVLLIRNMGKEILQEDEDTVLIKVNAGENWDEFVDWSIEKNLVGLHNLACIPGCVGACPVQNVGAYGVEIKDLLTEVEIFDLEDGNTKILKNKECDFGYRDSIFKRKLRNKVIIKSVTFKLQKFKGTVDEKYLGYSGIKEKVGEYKLTPKTIYSAVSKLREEKLPDVEEFGSCGSTFKNPEIDIKKYIQLVQKFPELPKYETSKKNIVKIPAAHILEKLGWKNRREGDVGTWIYHPLIVTNYGNAKPEEILNFIKKIQNDFERNTDIPLECEINII
jgi:UDP-N-acetylmuramate dehydrogenase